MAIGLIKLLAISLLLSSVRLQPEVVLTREIERWLRILFWRVTEKRPNHKTVR
jgi:hypothetical protein